MNDVLMASETVLAKIARLGYPADGNKSLSSAAEFARRKCANLCVPDQWKRMFRNSGLYGQPYTDSATIMERREVMESGICAMCAAIEKKLAELPGNGGEQWI